MKEIVRLTLASHETSHGSELADEFAQPQSPTPPSLDIPYALRSILSGLRILANDGAATSTEPRQSLIKALVRGYRWRQQLERGDVASYERLAEQAGVTRRYVARILRFGFLAPDLVDAILAGKQNPAMTTEMFRKTITYDWEYQRAQLGIKIE